MEEWVDPRVAATNLLQMLARYRQKDTLPRLLPFLEKTLSLYTTTPEALRDYQKKDGVMVALATICKILKESKTYRHLLEPLIVTHIIPEFKSPVAFLRSRACWVIEYFSECEWQQKETLPAILQGLLGGLRDPALPVQVGGRNGSAASCLVDLTVCALCSAPCTLYHVPATLTPTHPNR